MTAMAQCGRIIWPHRPEKVAICTIKEYCWIRVINQLIFIRKENFVIGDIEDFKRFIKLNTLAGEDWSRVWKGRN